MKNLTVQTKDQIKISMIPVGLGIVFYVIILYCYPISSFHYEPEAGMNICTLMMGIWATLLGFIITAVSILLSLSDNNKFISLLRDTKHFKTIIYSYLYTSTYLLVSIVIATAIVFFNVWAFKIWILIISISVMCFVSVAISIAFLFAVVIKGKF